MENVIKFDTGIREFNILGVVTVSFCPTDLNFAETVFQALEDIGNYYTDYQRWEPHKEYGNKCRNYGNH